MRISAHQPAYLPWAGYLERINMSELFIVLDEVQFEKNSFTNRNRIKTSNGLAWLTVPVNLKGHLSNSIRDIEISNDVSWRKKHWKTIQQNYQKSLFFDHHKVFFESIYNKDWKNLLELNRTILNYLLDVFEIKTEIVYLSELDIKASKQELIKMICKNFSASEFIFGPEGRNYANQDEFMEIGVEISFHEYEEIPYSQLWGDYIPNLSAIDLIMNVSSEKLKRYLAK